MSKDSDRFVTWVWFAWPRCRGCRDRTPHTLLVGGVCARCWEASRGQA